MSYIVEDLNVRNVCVCYMADAKLMKLELILNTLVAVRNRVLLQPAVSSLSSSHNNQRLPNAIFDGNPQQLQLLAALQLKYKVPSNLISTTTAP